MKKLILLAVSAVVATNLQANNVFQCPASMVCKTGGMNSCVPRPEVMIQGLQKEFVKDTPLVLVILHAYHEGTVDRVNCLYSKSRTEDAIMSYTNRMGSSLYPYDKKEWYKPSEVATCNPFMSKCFIKD